MRVFIIAAALVVGSFGAQACDRVPFASELKSDITHYNRAAHSLATSGKLGEGAVEELAANCVDAIIDLRTEKEGTADEKSKAEAAGLRYVNVPVTGAGVDDDQLEAFSRAYETMDGAVLLHCGSGNRVGAMLTRYYLSKGMSEVDAFELGRTAGMSPVLEEKVREHLK